MTAKQRRANEMGISEESYEMIEDALMESLKTANTYLRLEVVLEDVYSKHFWEKRKTELEQALKEVRGE